MYQSRLLKGPSDLNQNGTQEKKLFQAQFSRSFDMVVCLLQVLASKNIECKLLVDSFRISTVQDETKHLMILETKTPVTVNERP